jgi:septal ring factor EnvC (AmiA/AmiB activator)
MPPRRVFRAVPGLVVVLLACAVWSLPAGAQAPQPSERDRAGAAARRTADRLRALQREADALATQERTLLVDLRKLEVERQMAVENLSQIGRELADASKQLADSEARAAALARTADAQLPDVEARLVQLYKMGRAGYWRLLLNVDDLRALGRAYRAASTLTAIDRARVAEHYATLDALARERKALQARTAELESLHAQAARARTQLDRAVAARNTLVASIDARRDLNAQLIGELQAAQQRLQASIARLDSGSGAAPSLPLRPFQGDLPWPARGEVARRFGRQTGLATATRNGMELRVAEGDPVLSVHDGSVAYAEPFAGYGNLVIVDHGGRSYSLYGYLDSIEVARGQHVDAGTSVGTAGRNPEGNPALYFELRVDGAAVDPLQWLRRRP